MKIKHKIIVSFISLILTFSLLSLFLIKQLQEQGKQTVFAFNQPLQAVNSSHGAWETFLAFDRYADKILAMTEPAKSIDVQQKISQYSKAFNQQIQQAADASLEDKVKAQALEVEKLTNAWVKQISEHLAGANQTRLIDRRILAEDKVKIEHKLKALVAETLKESNHLAEKVEQDINNQLTTVYTILMMIGIIAIIVAVIITNSIVTPIQRLTAAVVELTRGDGDLTRRLDESANNEMGCLSHEFNFVYQ